MNRSLILLICLLTLSLGTVSHASDLPDFTLGGEGTLTGGVLDTGKAARDTSYLIGPWGSGAPVNGQFQDQAGLPSWNGWTHYDVTQPTISNWQLSDYAPNGVLNGTQWAWCGDADIPSCGGDDPAGGYGNNWNDLIEWVGVVADNSIGVNVTFSALANIDSEPGYDGTDIVYFDANGRQVAAYYDGLQTGVTLNASFSLTAADYQGVGNDEVLVQVNFSSDGGWSDAAGDCQWPTAGAIQIDDITVTMDQGSGVVTSFTDFETGFGDWAIGFPIGVGDFAKIWTNLEDFDPCASNFGPQVAFIDDGLVVPGTNGSFCQNWCYGPGGYIVNTTGGLAGPDAHLQVAIESPIIEWPAADADGTFLWFDAYRHEDLSADAPGIFYTWSVRSIAPTVENPAPVDTDIVNATWVDRNFVYYGGPDYLRAGFDVTDLIEPGRVFTQVQLQVYELGYAWGWEGDDGYPAPYFDNVRYIAYPFFGPGMAAREIDLANDNFPENESLDLVDLSQNWVRFDMARDISLGTELYNLPGDSIIVDITPVRSGAEFVGMPQLVWALNPNPLFNPYRGSLDVTGVVDGEVAVGTSGNPTEGTYAFDLPDSNFLFPGDVLHYYIKAVDAIGGAEQQEATIPASDPGVDPDGFGDFSHPLAYSSSFTVRALPTIKDAGEIPATSPASCSGTTSPTAVVKKSGTGAFDNLGVIAGRDYDIYYTNGPSSGVGNGLGGRATRFQLEGYDHMVYTAGDLAVNTISNGDFANDSGDDVGLLDAWLRQGGKNLFATGDELVYDLVINSGTETVAFVNTWMQVNFTSNDIRPLINNQTTPLVRALDGNGVFLDGEEWIAYGGCFAINFFDAVTTNTAGGGVQLAEFLDPTGASGQYTYSAATMFEDAVNTARVITMPYDFMYIYTNPSAAKANPASLPARATVLERVLGKFGVDPTLDTSNTPGAVALDTRVYPNPFNPTTKIQYTMPKAGHLTLKIYNVKGELVKTLIDESVEAGTNHIMWDGTNQTGAKVSSGVYFSEARTAGQVKVNKMALVK
jgi:hypothetical protein